MSDQSAPGIRPRTTGGAGISVAALFVVASWLSLSPAAFAQDESQAIQDAWQESRITTTFALNPYLRGSELSVDVENGKAVLSGTVPEGVHRELAEEIALAQDIESVDNQIQVQEDFVPGDDNGERSYGEVIEDAGITAAIKSKLLWSRYTEGLSTSVQTRQGHVTLEGTAVSEAAKDLAGLLARNTNGVSGVTNNLVVTPGEETRAGALSSNIRGATDQAGSTLSDAWITMKVKSTLLYSDNVSGSDISVSTEDGVVTLSGAVESGSEHELAVRLASNVRGVKDVVAQDLTY